MCMSALNKDWFNTYVLFDSILGSGLVALLVLEAPAMIALFHARSTYVLFVASPGSVTTLMPVSRLLLPINVRLPLTVTALLGVLFVRLSVRTVPVNIVDPSCSNTALNELSVAPFVVV